MLIKMNAHYSMNKVFSQCLPLGLGLALAVAGASGPARAESLRPPAVPLVTFDP